MVQNWSKIRFFRYYQKLMHVTFLVFCIRCSGIKIPNWLKGFLILRTIMNFSIKLQQLKCLTFTPAIFLEKSSAGVFGQKRPELSFSSFITNRCIEFLFMNFSTIKTENWITLFRWNSFFRSLVQNLAQNKDF